MKSALFGILFISIIVLNINKLYSQPPSNDYNLIFEDNFNSLNTEAWWVQNCFNSGTTIGRANNVGILNGNLNIKIKEDNPTCNGISLPYSSGVVFSSTHYLFGYFEFRAKFDSNKNIWPALWLLPSGNTNNYYEIDLMEACGKNPNKGYSNILQENNNDCILDSQDAIHDQQDYSLNNGYNIYGVEWAPSYIKVYINGVLKHTYNNTSNFNGFYHRIILSANVGNYEGCSPIPNSNEFPMNFDIDYFKAYQKLDASFQMKGPHNICTDDIAIIRWPYYEPFCSYSINLSNGLELVEDPNYSILTDYPEYDPICTETRNGVFSFFKIKGTSPGNQIVTLTMNFNSGYSKTVQKNIWVGPPVIEGYIYSNTYVGPLTNSTMGISSPSCQLNVSLDGASSFSWTKTGGDGTYSTVNNGKQVYISNIGFINLNVTGQGTCGTSTRSLVIFNYSGYYRVGPNPMADEIFITADPDLILTSINDNGDMVINKVEPSIEEVYIYDESGKLKKHKKFNGKNKKVSIQVNGLKAGNYFLEISNSNHKVIKSLIKI